MKLYHGSNQAIKNPDLSKGRKFLDFGAGFYLSVSKKQAENRAKSAKLFFECGIPTVNVFDFRECLTIWKIQKNSLSSFFNRKNWIRNIYLQRKMLWNISRLRRRLNYEYLYKHQSCQYDRSFDC